MGFPVIFTHEISISAVKFVARNRFICVCVCGVCFGDGGLARDVHVVHFVGKFYSSKEMLT